MKVVSIAIFFPAQVVVRPPPLVPSAAGMLQRFGYAPDPPTELKQVHGPLPKGGGGETK